MSLYLIPMLGALILCGLFFAPSFAQEFTEAITVTTDKKSYQNEDIVTVSGTVRERLSGYEVTMQIFSPNGNMVTQQSLPVSDDNVFEITLNTGGPLWKPSGTYTVKVMYGTATRIAQTTFSYGDSIKTEAGFVKTSKSSYEYGEVIVISGKVDTILPNTPLLIQVFRDTNRVHIAQVDVPQDGTFSYSLTTISPYFQTDGEYIVQASYGVTGNVYETSFDFQTDGSTSNEEILVESTEDGSIFIILSPIGINSHQQLSFELSFEDADDNPIEHVNFDISAIQNGNKVLAEISQHVHSGFTEFTTPEPVGSDIPLDIQVTILGIGLPDDEANWTGPKGETVSFRLVDFDIEYEDEYEEPSQTDLPYSETVIIPAGSSASGCESTNECYIPSEVAIDVGGEAVWVNNDSASHTVTSGNPKNGPDGNFDSGLFSTGQTFTHIFEEEGEFPYFCLVHPWMQGTIFVGQGVPNPTPIPTPDIELFVDTDKSEYDLGELATLNVHISDVSSPQNVAITITDPFGTVVVSRTLTTDSTGDTATKFSIAESFKTGTYRIDATSSIDGWTYLDDSEFKVTSQFNQIQIISAQGTDQQGNPMEFSRGNMGFVKVQVNAQKPIATLITVNVFDSDLTPLGVGSLKTTLNTGQSEMILSFMIPEDAVVGTADIYVNALSDWVSAGGIPQTGEFAGQVRIN